VNLDFKVFYAFYTEKYTPRVKCVALKSGEKLETTQAYRHSNAHWNLCCYCSNSGLTSHQWTIERDNCISPQHLRDGKSRMLVESKDTFGKIVKGKRHHKEVLMSRDNNVSPFVPSL